MLLWPSAPGVPTADTKVPSSDSNSYLKLPSPSSWRSSRRMATGSSWGRGAARATAARQARTIWVRGDQGWNCILATAVSNVGVVIRTDLLLTTPILLLKLCLNHYYYHSYNNYELYCYFKQKYNRSSQILNSNDKLQFAVFEITMGILISFYNNTALHRYKTQFQGERSIHQLHWVRSASALILPEEKAGPVYIRVLKRTWSH